MLAISEYLGKLIEARGRYEKTAPTVRDHCDDLYRRIQEDGDRVTLTELLGVSFLWAGVWLSPNQAANVVYKLRHRLGMDTPGHAGF